MTTDELHALGLTRHEVEVLAMLAGEREPEGGAWVAACLGYLEHRGYCTRSEARYEITDEGRGASGARASQGGHGTRVNAGGLGRARSVTVS